MELLLIFAGKVEIVRILVEHGAKVNIEIENKVTPLHYAVYSFLGKSPKFKNQNSHISFSFPFEVFLHYFSFQAKRM